MKVVVSSTGKDMSSSVSSMFARCPFFAIADIEGGEIKSVSFEENKDMDKPGGAGISTAQMVASKGANAVIAGSVGPRATDVLRQFNIEIYQANGSVEEALKDYISGKDEDSHTDQ